MPNRMREMLQGHVDAGTVPGAVTLVAQGDEVAVEAVGFVDVEQSVPMARDTIFRIASVTKPIVAAAVMTLVDDGRIALDDPVAEWLPEIASPTVVRTPESPVDDVVPARRPVTVEDLLTSRAGWGFPSDFSLPAAGLMFSEMRQGSPRPQPPAPPDEWMATLGHTPMLRQPGEAWLYNICSDIQGVLVSRVAGGSLPDVLAERVLAPLGMRDTGFVVPPASLDRFTSYYRNAEDGGLELADPPAGEWSSMPDFPSGAGGLVSTADDLLAFARMLLADGMAGGRRLLSTDAVRAMTTDHLTQAQRDGGHLFLDGQGWGYGGSVDVEVIDPWNVPGRYGWVGGTGTSSHIVPSTGAVAILLTQLEMGGPVPPAVPRDFWLAAS